MTKVLYISTFQFSGSTLLSFLLNTHPDITTVGHTTGWKFSDDDDFRCSCGQPLDVCPFYRAIANAYLENGLHFDIRNFGTAYRLSERDRLNRVLTAAIPLLQSTNIERSRDNFVRVVPGLSKTLRQTDRANLVFMRTALEYSGSKVFVDNSHDPYRFRHLARVGGLELCHLHLIRDPRGVALSCRRNSGWDIELGMHLWLRRQSDIFRISEEAAQTYKLYYEDLCSRVTEVLSLVHKFVGVDADPFAGDFRTTEHHILGNDMRLSASEVRLDTRWQRDLSEDDLGKLTRIAHDFVGENPDSPVSKVLQHYFESL